MAKNRQIAENLVLLRMAVGAAGEDKNLAWWRSAFCGSMLGACLAPVFPKTVALAAQTGVNPTACRKDHATAIAHDLEDALWEEVEVARRGYTVKDWREKEFSAAEVKGLIEVVNRR